MIHRLRVLLLEPSRYFSLLMEREISGMFKSAVVARFESEGSAVEELGRTRYDIAVVDVEQATGEYGDLLADIRESCPQIVLIAVGPQGFFDIEGSDGLVWADQMIPRDDQTPQTLPGVIAQFSKRWQQIAGQEGSEGILDAESRAAVINLTVRTLAHEINNPLMTIMGTTELLLEDDGEFPADQVKKIRMIQDSAQRIQTTLADLAGEDYPATRRTPVGPMLESRRLAEPVG
ncbi:MAG: hypothetical protein GY867_00700 [bacterium]|nr:hypothetical protein [bacterium]